MYVRWWNYQQLLFPVRNLNHYDSEYLCDDQFVCYRGASPTNFGSRGWFPFPFSHLRSVFGVTFNRTNGHSRSIIIFVHTRTHTHTYTRTGRICENNPQRFNLSMNTYISERSLFFPTAKYWYELLAVLAGEKKLRSTSHIPCNSRKIRIILPQERTNNVYIGLVHYTSLLLAVSCGGFVFLHIPRRVAQQKRRKHYSQFSWQNMSMMSQHPICFMEPNGSASEPFFASNQIYLQPTLGTSTRHDIREKLNSHVKRRIQGMEVISSSFFYIGIAVIMAGTSFS